LDNTLLTIALNPGWTVTSRSLGAIGVFIHDLVDDGGDVLACKRLLSDEHFIKDHAQAEQV